MQIIDGREIAKKILEELKSQLGRLSFKPLFCDVLVGEDAVSASFVKIKAQTAENLGIDFKLAKYPNNLTASHLVEEIQKLNQVPHMSGLIVQLPLPESLPKDIILDAINPDIDVDCVGSVNSKNFYAGSSFFVPPTAGAILYILDSLQVDLKNLKFLVIGQGELVGKPVTFLLKQRGYAVDTADKSTQNLAELLRSADVIISAAGTAGLVRGSEIKIGAIVVDAGSSEQNGSITGDVDFMSVQNKASFITPVPGGVGPVTVAMLLKNVVEAAKKLVNA